MPRLIGETVAIGVLLAVPHLQYAIAATGSPTGILSGAATAATTTGPWDAIRQYVQWIPSTLAGPVAWVVVLLGVLHAVGIGVGDLRRRTLSNDLRRHGWILGTATGSAVLIVAASHSEARYQIFPLTLGVVAGAGAGIKILGSRASVEQGRWDRAPSRREQSASLLLPSWSS